MSDIFKFYPEPKYNKIIEPFGFPVNYSLLYWEKDILINDLLIEDFVPTNEKMLRWKFSSRPYYNLPNEEATWFIDAPRKSSSIDYQFLADWCKNRKGQEIVAQNTKATWLKFKEILNGEGFWSNFSIKEVKTQLKIWI